MKNTISDRPKYKREDYYMEKPNIFYDWWVVVGTAILLAVLGPAAVAMANIYQYPLSLNMALQTVSSHLVIL